MNDEHVRSLVLAINRVFFILCVIAGIMLYGR